MHWVHAAPTTGKFTIRRCNMIRLALRLTLLLVLISHSSACANPSVSRSTVLLTVFSCTSSTSKPVVEIAARIGAAHRALGAPAIGVRQGVWTYKFSAPKPVFWLSVQAGKCHDEFPVVVVPDHTRRLYAFLAPLRYLTFSEGYWLDGCLPKGMYKVQLRYSYGRIIDSAAIDDGCYYLFVPSPGTYELAITAHIGMVFRTDVSIKGELGSVVRRDVTLSEVRNRFVH